jgi:hypothetical protein
VVAYNDGRSVYANMDICIRRRKMKFRKKPVVIEAVQWFTNGDHPEDHLGIGEGPFTQMDLEKYCEYLETEGRVVRYYRHPSGNGEDVCDKCGKLMSEHGWIDTLEGGHIVCVGDWIITGVQGEFCPCKPDIFELSYESVGE